MVKVLSVQHSSHDVILGYCTVVFLSRLFILSFVYAKWIDKYGSNAETNVFLVYVLLE